MPLHSRIGRLVWGLAAMLAVLLVLPQNASAGSPPMDPRQMSGMPRRDAQIPGGTITVRVLRGAFDKPALEHPVELKVTDVKGTTSKTFTLDTANQGRATFSDLKPFIGGRAVAKVELDGETLTSAPIDIAGDIGTAVMLVSRGDAAAAAPPTRPKATSATPLPGAVFAFDKVGAGELMVGAFDLAAKRALPGATIVLRIQPPTGEATTQSKVTDGAGKVVFDGLGALPKGTKLVAESQFSEAEPVRHSETFEVIEGKGMAVVLARGTVGPPAPAPDPHTAAQAQRQRVPGPRMTTSLPQGTVRVRVIDGADRPVADQEVVVVMIDASQTEVPFVGVTDRTGVALVSDVSVRSDAFYSVRVRYDEGPYRSGFFQMDKEGGIAVDLRVFATTSDPDAVQSALQYEIRESENDHAQIYRIYEIVVRGDKAYWQPGGFRMDAAEDAKSVTVLRPAEPWLNHDEGAPFATLSRPIPPGEPVHLSMAWVEEHSGEVEVEWTPPFALMQAGVIVKKGFTLEAVGASESDRKPPDTEVALWDLPANSGPIVFTMSGLPIRDPTFRYLGIGLGIGLGLLAGIALLRTPRRSAVQRLTARRDELLGLLRTEASAGPGVRRDRIVAALDRVYRQIDALQGTRDAKGGAKASGAAKAKAAKSESRAAKSEADKVEPKSDKAEPKSDKAEPKSDKAEPKPKSDKAEPKPKSDKAESNSDKADKASADPEAEEPSEDNRGDKPEDDAS